MESIKQYQESTFEDIKHINKFGNEYWEARELQSVLEYVKWQKFLNVIGRAIVACNNSGFDDDEHFTQVGKMINIGKSATREVIDYHLSRYACYLIMQNADPRKKVVALGLEKLNENIPVELNDKILFNNKNTNRNYNFINYGRVPTIDDLIKETVFSDPKFEINADL